MELLIVAALVGLCIFLIKVSSKKKKPEQKHNDLIATAVMAWTLCLEGIDFKDIDFDKQNEKEFFLMAYLKIKENKDVERPEEAAKKFANLLTDYLVTQSRKTDSVTLQTEWSAQHPLLVFLRKAGLGPNALPRKSVMWVDFKDQTVTWRVNLGAIHQLYPVVDEPEKELV